jgi:hypothetical protein
MYELKESIRRESYLEELKGAIMNLGVLRRSF